MDTAKSSGVNFMPNPASQSVTGSKNCPIFNILSHRTSNISVKNKPVNAKELEAIIASTALQVAPTFKLKSYVINSGNIIPATANITMTKNGEKISGNNLLPIENDFGDSNMADTLRFWIGAVKEEEVENAIETAELENNEEAEIPEQEENTIKTSQLEENIKETEEEAEIPEPEENTIKTSQLEENIKETEEEAETDFKMIDSDQLSNEDKERIGSEIESLKKQVAEANAQNKFNKAYKLQERLIKASKSINPTGVEIRELKEEIKEANESGNYRKGLKLQKKLLKLSKNQDIIDPEKQEKSEQTTLFDDF